MVRVDKYGEKGSRAERERNRKAPLSGFVDVGSTASFPTAGDPVVNIPSETAACRWLGRDRAM